MAQDVALLLSRTGLLLAERGHDESTDGTRAKGPLPLVVAMKKVLGYQPSTMLIGCSVAHRRLVVSAIDALGDELCGRRATEPAGALTHWLEAETTVSADVVQLLADTARALRREAGK